MGFSRGPKIVTNGLVLTLDAGSKKSYAGSGTTWTDLSGNGNTGTLVNGTTFDSGNGGVFSFDGVNDYIRVNTGDKIRFQDSSVFTVSFWFNWESITGAQSNRQYLWDNRSASENYYVVIIDNANAGTPGLKAILNGASAEISATSTLPSFNTWVHYTAVFNITGGIVTSYVNGIQSATAQNTPVVSGTSGATAYIGTFRGISGGYKFNGNIANFKIYNKALSAAEVLQNYNATKSRFI
jgi:hypothetical protein